ncbi:MAG: YfiR family protein [Candidatus Hydrogenedentales bacterium]
MRRAFLAPALASAFTMAFFTHAGAQRQAEDRAALTAAFLFKFLSFVEWPDSAFASPADPFRIVVLHDDEVRAAVVKSVAGKEVKGRTIEIQDSASGGECHIVFIGETNDEKRRETLASVAGEPVLTVGLDDEFAKQGGIIRLFESERRLNIEVNLAAAQQADLEISSKLLAVARVLREDDLKAQVEFETGSQVQPLD